MAQHAGPSVTATAQASSALSLPADTYIYSLTQLRHSSSSSLTTACVASPSSLVLFDHSTLRPISHIPKCHSSVTALSTTGDEHLLTAGRDGLVKLWDTRSNAPSTTLHGEGGKGFSAVAGSGALVAAGTENDREGPSDVSVCLWDTRSPGQMLRNYTDSHNDTVTTLAFHPTERGTLLSAATDGLATLFATAHADEEDAVLQVFNHSGAIHRAGFLADDEVVAISADERMGVYQRAKEGEVEREDVKAVETQYGDVRGVLGAGYVVELVGAGKETWVAAGELGEKLLMLTPLVRKEGGRPTEWRFDHTKSVKFPGAHGEEVVRDVMLLEDRTVLTCGEDGMVRAWKVPDDQAEKSMEMDVDDEEEDAEARKERKRRKKEKKEKARFKPY